MRTGAEYREALRDGRRVWVMGEGMVDDVTTHPATRAMVDEYVAWYDLHVRPCLAGHRAPPPAPRQARPLGLCRAKDRRRTGGDGPVFAASTF